MRRTKQYSTRVFIGTVSLTQLVATEFLAEILILDALVYCSRRWFTNTHSKDLYFPFTKTLDWKIHIKEMLIM